ncbi:Dpp4p, partial [Spiromyces aspiralis]
MGLGGSLEKSSQDSCLRRRFTFIQLLLILLVNSAAIIAIFGVWAALRDPPLLHPAFKSVQSGMQGAAPPRGNSRPCITYEEVLTNTYAASTPDILWIPDPARPGVDGLRFEELPNQLVITSISDPRWLKVLATRDSLAKANGGKPFEYFSARVSSDWRYILFGTRFEKLWRHSFQAAYYIYSVEDGTLAPLMEHDNHKVQLAQWAPSGHRLSFVLGNNLYVTDTKTTIRVTDNGGPSIFNGICDWIYEEEILEDSYSHWWSPDGEAIAYLNLDDSDVPLYNYSLYYTENATQAYPQSVQLHYPKPGYPNPRASLYVYQPDFNTTQPTATNYALASDTAHRPTLVHLQEPAFGVNDLLYTQIKWVTDTHENLLVRVMNRVQDHTRVYLARIDDNTDNNDADPADSAGQRSLHARITREWNTNRSGGDGAWIDITKDLIYIKPGLVPGFQEGGYIDLVPHGDFTHLALFSPLTAREPAVYLTNGTWDVIDGSLALDDKRAMLYYLSTEDSSIQHNSKRVSLRDLPHANGGLSSEALTPPRWAILDQYLAKVADTKGTYDISFSAGCEYVHVKYLGPGYPWSVVRRISPGSDVVDPEFEVVTSTNKALRNKLAKCSTPTTRYFTIDAGDAELNAMEVVPPDFDEDAAGKYGVLFNVYGGPNSQLVSQKFNIDWHRALVSQTEHPNVQFVVVTVDGRGTAHKGRPFRSAVSKQLGVLEVQDQVSAARYMQSRKYVDPDRIAIWGWSYGGYMTTRAIEAAPDVFKVGMAVAPVTDWTFYDSVYTERYMKTPQMNSEGYKSAAVHNMTSFKHARYFVQHGTGDDNVHTQHTYALVDHLQMAGVKTFEMAEYTDADHSIIVHNARPLLFYRLKEFLFRSFKEL